MKRSALIALALVTALGLTGCSGDDTDDASSDSASTRATTSTAPSAGASDDAPGIVSPSLPDVPEFSVGPQGVINDVTVADCTTDPGTVTASGTARNTGQFERDIVVVVNWAVTSTSDVLARGVTALEDVPPGESRDWKVTAELAPGQDVACVPLAYAGQL